MPGKQLSALSHRQIAAHASGERGPLDEAGDLLVVILREKTGWREVEIGRGSSDSTCPVVTLQTRLKLVRIARGPVFRRVTGQGRRIGAAQ